MTDYFDLDAVLTSPTKERPYFDLDEILAAQEKPSAASRFGSRVAQNAAHTIGGMVDLGKEAVVSSLTPQGQVTFLPRMAANMYQGAVQYGADAIARQLPNGASEATPGQALRATVAAVPVVGGYAMNRVSDVEEGKGPEAAADVVFDAVSMMIPGSKAGRAASGAVARGALRAGEATGKAGLVAAKEFGPELAAGLAGATVGGWGGAATALAAMNRLRAIAKRFLRARGMSEKAAEKAASEMPEKALQNMAQSGGMTTTGIPSAVEAIPSSVVRPSPLSASASIPMPVTQAPAVSAGPTRTAAMDLADRIKERVLSMKAQGMSRGQMRASVSEDLLTWKNGFRPVDAQRAVDLILKEGVQ